MKTKALELSNCLFELEADSIFNDPESHWWVNSWNEKYGEDSIQYKDFSLPEEEIQKLADILYQDYSNNVLNSLEYNPYTADNYAGFITQVFERELASRTKVGFQLTILN